MQPTTLRDIPTAASLATPFIALRAVAKRYTVPSGSFAALTDVSLSIHAGECVAVIGKSGSGKTTLINLLTGIDVPSDGELVVGTTSVHRLSEQALSVWRGRHVGIVFQFFQLLPTLTVAENVILPMDFCAVHQSGQRRRIALDLLDRLGIADQADKLPADLSGGQQQRAAIARALANDPPLIVADEPTGNLDSATSHAVMSMLSSLAADGKTVITVTHEREFSRYFTRSIALHDGRIVSDERVVPVGSDQTGASQ
ncbi:ABC transporter ATP-binding protein [Gemmatimonas sp.]|uniref:ABC transporter ATP-binding protein n=1 Tax=Gemmatimonas sp. TaxID=1962908 RepID=UPI003983699F